VSTPTTTTTTMKPATTPVSGNIDDFANAGFYQSLRGLYCKSICLLIIIIAKLSQFRKCHAFGETKI